MNAITRLQNLLARVEKAHANVEKRQARVFVPYDKKIEALKKKREQAGKGLGSIINRLADKASTIERKIQEAIRAKEAKEFRVNAPTDFESFKKWLSVTGLKQMECKHDSIYNAEPIRVKDTIKGINIQALKGWDTKYYAAFKGTRLVGWMIVELPKHRGDETQAVGKIKGKKINFQKPNWSYYDNPALHPYETFINTLKRRV